MRRLSPFCSLPYYAGSGLAKIFAAISFHRLTPLFGYVAIVPYVEAGCQRQISNCTITDFCGGLRYDQEYGEITECIMALLRPRWERRGMCSYAAF
jgi:hypothetical protein